MTLADYPVLASSLRVAHAVRELLSDPGLNLGRLSDAVRIEPEITSTLLRMANTAAFAPTEPVVDVYRAISVIGTAQVRVLALQVVMRHLVDGIRSPLARRYAERVWEHSLEVACIAEQVARGQGLTPEQTHALGLLHDLPVLLFLNGSRDQPGLYADAQSLLAAARQWRGPSAARLARSLGVPELIVTDLAELDAGESGGDAVEAVRTAHACVGVTYEFDRFKQRALSESMDELLEKAMARKDALLDVVRMAG